MPFIPACFAVAALCSPIQAYSIEFVTPNDEALISSVVSTKDDLIEADGAFEKDSLGSTGDAGDITPDDAQTPAVGDNEAGVFSPVPDAPTELSPLPSNPQISDFPAADIDEGVYEISNAGSNRVLDVSGGSCDNGANVQQYGQNGTPAQRWRIEKYNGHYLPVKMAATLLSPALATLCSIFLAAALPMGETHKFMAGTLRMHRFGISLRSLRLSMTAYIDLAPCSTAVKLSMSPEVL